MEEAQGYNPIHTRHRSDELLKRIRKLRWIGLEEEARELQRAMLRMSPEHDVPVPGEPFSTDSSLEAPRVSRRHRDTRTKRFRPRSS